MATNAMTVQGLFALSCSLDERPPVTMSNVALEALHQEREDARTAWYRALLHIPTRPGARRTNAISKCMRLKDRYEQLLGHPVGKPDESQA